MAEALRSIIVLAEGADGLADEAHKPVVLRPVAVEPDIETVRMRKAERLIRERALRHRFLPAGILREPDFDMLLDLFVQSRRGQDVSVSSLCVASQVPATTALRHIEVLAEMNLVHRERDPNDRRRWIVRLTTGTVSSMIEWLDSI